MANDEPDRECLWVRASCPNLGRTKVRTARALAARQHPEAWERENAQVQRTRPTATGSQECFRHETRVKGAGEMAFAKAPSTFGSPRALTRTYLVEETERDAVRQTTQRSLQLEHRQWLAGENRGPNKATITSRSVSPKDLALAMRRRTSFWAASSSPSEKAAAPLKT